MNAIEDLFIITIPFRKMIKKIKLIVSLLYHEDPFSVHTKKFHFYLYIPMEFIIWTTSSSWLWRYGIILFHLQYAYIPPCLFLHMSTYLCSGICIHMDIYSHFSNSCIYR